MFEGSLGAYVVFAALLTLAPGADTIVTTKNAVLHGRRAGLVTSAGVVSGLLVHATLSALGLSLILARSAAAYQTVKLAGAVYLVWLGARTILETVRDEKKDPATSMTTGASAAGATTTIGHAARRRASPLRRFREGLLSNVLNPKVALFYLTLLPQFIDPAGAVLAQSLLLGGIHAGMGLAWLAVLSVGLGAFHGALGRPWFRRGMGYTGGGSLMGLGALVAFEKG